MGWGRVGRVEVGWGGAGRGGLGWGGAGWAEMGWGGVRPMLPRGSRKHLPTGHPAHIVGQILLPMCVSS